MGQEAWHFACPAPYRDHRPPVWGPVCSGADPETVPAAYWWPVSGMTTQNQTWGRVMAVNLPAELQNLSWTQKAVAMAGVVGLALFMGFSALPSILGWWRIQVIKTLKATARRNPVETLQIELIARKEALETAGAKIVSVSVMRASLHEKLEEYVQKHQTNDPSLETSIYQLSELVDRLRASVDQAEIKLGEFERFVARQADRWKLAKATGELAVLLKASGGADVTARFLQDEAIDSIRDSLNLSFAQIDQILRTGTVRQIVETGPATTLGHLEKDLAPPGAASPGRK
jgi:hypothetical protein